MSGTSLSWAQQIVWAGQATLPDSPHYNQAFCCDLTGPLDPMRLEAAFDHVAASHDALRMVFLTHGADVSQSPTGAAPRLAHHTAPDRAAAQDWMQARALEPFDLTVSATRATLIRIAADHHVLFVVQHHLVTDGRAAGLLLNAVGAAYSGETPAPSPTGFADVAQTLRLPQPTSAFDATRDIAPLPLYGCEAGLGGTQMVSTPLPLGPDRQTALANLAQHKAFQAFTPLMAMQNILATLVAGWLARVTSQTQVAFALPQHNRTAAQRDTIGLFMEILPLGVKVQDGDSFRDLHMRITQATRTLMTKGGAGTTRVDLLRNRNVLLNIFTGAPVHFAGLGAHSHIVPVASADPAHDLNIEFEDLDGTGIFAARMVFDAGRFDAATRSAAAGHFLALFDAFMANPDTPIAAVDILGTGEHTQLDAFNSAANAPVPEGTVVDAFVANLSDAPAVRTSGAPTALSHHALNRAADRMARMLVHHGARAGDRIAVHLPRSVQTVIAVLAIHKIGAAFVPLETTLAPERRDFILQDTAARLVISNTLSDALHPKTAEPFSDAPFATQARADDAAYVIYTSGSTGQPKGVVVGHRALLGYCLMCLESYPLEPAQRFAFFSAFGFDLTINSLFMPLVSGGEIIVYPAPETGPDLAILDVFAKDEVDVAKPTPSHLRLGVAAAKQPLKRIKTLAHSGEAFPDALACAALKTFGPHLRLINEYGPTEAVVGAMMHHFDPARPPAPLVSLGRPAAGMRIYVLNPRRARQPVGVAGEIAIGGRLADGYLNRPELTADRFVDNPLVAGEKLYLTGDLGVFRSASDLHYLGRMDDQVKLGGIRLELGEVEHAIARLPQVIQTVAALRPNPAGQPALVAFVQGDVAKADVVNAARAVLPTSTSLAAVVNVPDIPVTPNGKIDRARLPEPSVEDWHAAPASRPPETPTEIALAQVYAQVLGHTNIGAEDDFYALGGDSLSAVKITNAARTAGLHITAIDIFRQRTISNLAAHVPAPAPARPAAQPRAAFSRVSNDLKAQLGAALRPKT